MSEPDLKLGGLSMWLSGRSDPGSSDYWDANWLNVRATMHVAQSSVSTAGSILMTTDFEKFLRELRQMNLTLKGEASLWSYEPNLKVTLRSESLGQISGQVEITPDHLSEFHRFDWGFDQTYLPPLIAACETIVARFPVVGNPNA